MERRKVHDILSETGSGGQRRPVAFIQHGNREDGMTYEAICPWCGDTLAYIPEKNTLVVGGLYRVLLYAQKLHWPNCKEMPSALELEKKKPFAVEITQKPLNVEKPFLPS